MAIPIEGLRVGADVFASDLNPVSAFLNKILIEFIPKYGQRLSQEVRKWGQWIKKKAEEELGQFYPTDPDGSTPIAYLWARTIHCEGPGCGVEIPLLDDLWLSQRAGLRVALRIIPNKQEKSISFVMERNVDPKSVGSGIVRRSSATCPLCGFTTPANRVRSQFAGRAGGTKDARLIAVVVGQEKSPGKNYREPTKQDYKAIRAAWDALENLKW